MVFFEVATRSRVAQVSRLSGSREREKINLGTGSSLGGKRVLRVSDEKINLKDDPLYSTRAEGL